MYLKTIEIQGFKSFANKIVLKFDKGITAIVGPNGSGKSNVADAVRWVLGEQSAKQLRGSKMEDVIFSGTQARKPLGYAYVAITFDNSDHALPFEYQEVKIARRVYRSGESEYLMNDAGCRLKDIQELFFDTGIGKEGYSIIGQGQIDKILSGKPEERRELFDEAAGIVKFKKRKQAAIKNLEEEQQNLSRVQDILKELEKQLGPLKTQSETARTWLKLRDRQKQLEVNLFLIEMERIRGQLSSNRERLTIAGEEMDRARQELQSTKAEYEQLETELEQYAAGIDAQNQAVNELMLRKEKLEGDRRLFEEQISGIRRNLTQGTQYLEELKASLELKEQAFTLESEKQKIIEDNVASASEAEKESTQSHQQIREQIDLLHQKIDDANSDIIEKLNEAASLKERMGRYDTLDEQINIRKTQLSGRLITLKSEESDRAQAVKDYETSLEKISDNCEQTRELLEEYTERSNAVALDLSALREQIQNLTRQYHADHSRYQAISDIQERYEGYGSSVRRIMEQKKDYPGIIGVVADLIRVDARYETAIETALGGSIQHVVTEDADTAKALIQLLKKNRYGRATFLPLTTITAREGDFAPAVLKEDGIIGVASELVRRSNPRYDTLIKNLLGRILVADTIDHALAAAKKYRQSLRIVTLEGEMIYPGGSMSGGAYKNSSSLLSRGRELAELKEKIKQIRLQMDEADKEQAILTRERQKLKTLAEETQTHLQALVLEENTARMTLEQARTALDQSGSLYEQLSSEESELDRQMEQIQKSRGALERQQDALNEQRIEKETLVEQLNDELDHLMDEEVRASELETGRRLALSEAEQNREFVRLNVSRIRSEAAQLQRQIESAQESARSEEELLLEKEQAIEACAGTITGLEEKIAEQKARTAELIASRDALSEGHRHFFEKREEITDYIALLDKEIYRLEHTEERLQEEKNNQSDYLWTEYELTISTAEPFRDEACMSMSTAALKRAVAQQKTEIKALGPVNIGAIDTYQEVSERYELQKTQHDDLVEAGKKLTGIIQSLDREMRRQFTDMFAKIQMHFDQVFKELFGGGSGTLELTEDEDILDAGIRIIASPPGKKLQNMMQLSGGEKALTAIALLFAIQRLKPSPFCLLDEIEAALDEANVVRYAHYLNNLTKDTQFIIITHRRGTMSAADVLYGITMQERGVSALISVSLIDSKLDN